MLDRHFRMRSMAVLIHDRASLAAAPDAFVTRLDPEAAVYDAVPEGAGEALVETVLR